MSRFKQRPLAAAILALFSTAAFAQAQSEQVLPEVKVRGATEPGFKTESTGSATRTETPLRDIPQIVNTVPQELIRSQGATSLQDALRNVPGISYAAAEGGTQANQLFYLRGFPAGGDLFMDGIRDMGEYNRDLFNVDSVEVLKGPSALMFGRGSTGGVINQTTKIANLLPRKELGLTLGSFNQKRLTGDINLRTGENAAFRLVMLGEDGNSYRYPQDVRRVGFAPSFRFGIGTATEVTLSYSYLDTKEVTDYGQPTIVIGGLFRGFAPVSPRAYYGYANHDYSNHQTHIATAKIEHRFSDALSLKNTLRFANYKRQMEATISTLRNTDINGAALTAATPLNLMVVTRNHDTGRTRDNDDHTLINQTEVTWKVATGGIRHTVLGGLELATERLNRWNYALDANPATAAIEAPTSIAPLLGPDPNTQLSYTKTPNLKALARGDTYAVYLQDQLELSHHWKALLGLRWEQFSARAEQLPLRAGLASPAGPFARTDRMLSGRAGLIWQPTGAQSYYVSYGNSYNPSGELGVYGGTATNLTAVNQTLEPEKNRNYEAGAQWDLTPGVRLRGAVFRNEKTNARMVDPALGVNVLAGVRRIEGTEFELTGAITKDWDIYSGIALLDGRIVKGPANVQGNTPLGVADISANLWTVYRLGGGWEIGGGARGNSGAFMTDTNNGALPKYVVYDATAAWVQKSYELRLNLYNLADKVYYTGAYNNSPNRVLPGQPRAMALTLRYDFF